MNILPENLADDDKVRFDPFLFEKFKTGAVFLQEDDLKPVDKINFNILTNDVTAVKNGKTLFYDPHLIKGFVVEDKGQKRIFIRGKPADTNELEFFELIINDKITVMIDRDYILKKGYHNTALNVEEKDTFKQQQTIYIMRIDEPVLLAKNKKAVLNFVQSHKREIEEAAAKKGIGYKKTADIIELLAVYNSLINQ